MPQIWRTPPVALDEAAVAAAVAALEAGGVVAYPTDTLYALGADAWRRDAVERVFALKGRDPGVAMPLIASDLSQVERSLGRLSPVAHRLAAAFWPGPFTLVVPAPASLPLEVLGGGSTVAIRVPAHDVARALARGLGRPIVATSANLAGCPATDDPETVLASLGARLDGLVDAGRTVGGPPSTIVDVIGDAPRLVREGAVPWERVVQSARA